MKYFQPTCLFFILIVSICPQKMRVNGKVFYTKGTSIALVSVQVEGEARVFLENRNIQFLFEIENLIKMQR